MILDVIDYLNNSPLMFCQQLGQTLAKLDTTHMVKFFNNYIPTRSTKGTGYLGGDAHPPGVSTDPYSGQIHVYDGGRSSAAMSQTIRHEAAHFMGLPDGNPVTTTDPFEMNAEQAGQYCS